VEKRLSSLTVRTEASKKAKKQTKGKK